MAQPDRYGHGLEVAPEAHPEVAAHEHLRSTQHLPEVLPGEYYGDNGLKQAVSPSTYPHPASAYPAGLESVVDEHHNDKYGHGNGGYLLPPGYAGYAGDEPAEGGKRKWLIIGGVVAVLVIVGAVLGGVLGSRAVINSASTSAESTSTSTSTSSSDSSSNNNPSETNTAHPSATPSATPKMIRSGSALSVTARRRPDGNTETYLFFQDPQDGLRYVRCNSGGRVTGNETACWEAPETLKSYAKAGTRIAASMIVWGEEFDPQIEIFYAGYQTRLLAVSFRPYGTTTDDSLNKLQLYTSLDSPLTAYWPWTLYTNATDNRVYHLRNQLVGSRTFKPAPVWDHNQLDATPRHENSSLAIVPTSTNFSMTAVKAGYAYFYQTTSNKLAVEITDLTSPQRPARFVTPWPIHLPDISLPAEGAQISAFSVGRAGDPSQRVNTYVVYRTADGHTEVLFSDPTPSSSSSSSSTTDNTNAEDGSPAVWRTTRPAALQTMDKGSDLACLTMATWVSSDDGVASLLEPATGENRCFFQAGGVVREVKLDAGRGEWVAVGEVPIP
ncbi:uncharacterized protein C8A04DRAFT_40539 [Dichotomopilus funicola]|uniref:Fucose-specific lectin n=1 Tax=Dichotomopilus funicola TaxID=1934379 RepID=A0AAN6ZJB2_9PEZI|nr:hypothetical protein C8A04DRAFT_40539 [Dichotomopilus funicola]